MTDVCANKDVATINGNTKTMLEEARRSWRERLDLYHNEPPRPII